MQLLPIPAEERSPADELPYCPVSEIRILLSVLCFLLVWCFWWSRAPRPSSWSCSSPLHGMDHPIPALSGVLCHFWFSESQNLPHGESQAVSLGRG